MKKAAWLIAMFLLTSLFMVGCEGGDDDPADPSPAPTNTTSGTSAPAASTLANQTVSIPMGATHETGILTAPAAGALSARIKSLVGSDLKGSFYRISDGATISMTTGPDFTISTSTTSGQTWRVKVFNPSGVAIDTSIKVDYVP